MDFASFGLFDYIVLFIVGASTLFAFAKGFWRTFLSLVSWIGAFFVAAHLVPLVEPAVGAYLESETAIYVVSVIIAFVVSLVGLILLTIPIMAMLRPVTYGVVDRTLGFSFGLVRGLVLVCIIFVVVVVGDVLMNYDEEEVQLYAEGGIFGDQHKEGARVGPVWLQGAQTYTILRMGSRYLIDLLPEDAFERVEHVFTAMRGDHSDEAVALELLGEEQRPHLLKDILKPEELLELKKSWKNGEENGTKQAEGEVGYAPDEIDTMELLLDQVAE